MTTASLPPLKETYTASGPKTYDWELREAAEPKKTHAKRVAEDGERLRETLSKRLVVTARECRMQCARVAPIKFGSLPPRFIRLLTH